MSVDRDDRPLTSEAGHEVTAGVAWLTGVLATASVVAGAGTVLWPGVLTGTVVMNGSARGTGLVVAAVGAPVLVVSLVRSRRGSVAATPLLLGSAAYLTYNAVMFCFATPFNALFPAYVTMLGAGVMLVARAVPLVASSARTLDRTLLRWVGVWILTVVVLNCLLWLAQVWRAALSEVPTEALSGTGLTTNPVWVQDLAVWLPVMAWLGLGALGVTRPRAALVTAGLAFWALEACGVAVDQWWGHRADPASIWASAGAVWLFLVTAIVDVTLLVLALRQLATDPRPARGRP